MSVYPINLDIMNRECAVVGGGSVAWRKANSLVQAGARVTVISPSIVEPFLVMVKRKEVIYKNKCYKEGDLEGFFLVICATDKMEINRAAAMEAKSNGALVNIVDRSFPSDFTVPAQVSRGDLLLTVSTGGRSPAFAKQLQRELAARYGDEYAVYLDFVAKMRDSLQEDLPDSNERVKFWQKIINQDRLNLVRDGKLNKAEAEIKNAIGSFGAES